MEQTDFSKYGKSFQEKLAYLIMTERPFADQIGEVLDVNFLELKYLQVLVNKIYEYKSKYQSHPSLKIVGSILGSSLDDEDEVVVEQVKDYFKQSITNIDILEDAEYVKDTALDFCRKQKLKEAMMKSVRLLNNSSFEEISGLIDEAIKLGSDTNFGYDYKADFEERYQIRARNPVSTGWDHVDDLCKGGLGRGELGVCIAPTGAGKSMALVHLGATAVKNGLSVVHYTLELSDTAVGSRYDSCLTGVSLKDLHGMKEQIYEKVNAVAGNVIIKEYPTKSATTMTIRTHLEKIKQRGIPVDMIIVDYGDLLKPISSSRNSEKRHDLESIYEELRGISQINKCPLWTASQTNRSGVNAELVTMENISEAFNKCFVADFIFSLARTKEDKAANKGRIFIAKNRNGPDHHQMELHMNTDNVKIQVLSPDEYEGAPDAKTQKEIMAQKYKELRKA